MLTLVVPALNEADIIEDSVRELYTLFEQQFPQGQIIVVNNGSTDGTGEIVEGLAGRLDFLGCLHLKERGKSRAIREGWSKASTNLLGFIDADLSPDPESIPTLVRACCDHRGLAVGSRHCRDSEVDWQIRRIWMSRLYNWLLKSITDSAVNDHQCGLKVIHRDFWQRIADELHSTDWFLDTELILHARRLGVELTEHPIKWVDKPGSKVSMLKTTSDLLAGLKKFRDRYGLSDQ